MTTPSASGGYGDVPLDGDEARVIVQRMGSLWWAFLVAGICWIIGALVILQFDSASIATIGLITGAMFVVSGLQQIVLAVLGDSMRALSAIFGVLFLIAGLVCFFNPADTFKGLADVLGFLFLIVGIWWVIRAFMFKSLDPTWWLGLIAGVLMVIMAFWTSGQFFIEKAYTLIAFAGIWALMHGITDIFRAFALRSLRNL